MQLWTRTQDVTTILSILLHHAPEFHNGRTRNFNAEHDETHFPVIFHIPCSRGFV
jgi:hypothetical protein